VRLLATTLLLVRHADGKAPAAIWAAFVLVSTLCDAELIAHSIGVPVPKRATKIGNFCAAGSGGELPQDQRVKQQE
jgi:hypothetical protein